MPWLDLNLEDFMVWIIFEIHWNCILEEKEFKDEVSHLNCEENPTRLMDKKLENLSSSLDIQSFINGGFWKKIMERFCFGLEGFYL